MVVPIRLGNNAVGCLEVANKKRVQDFTSNDLELVQQISDEIASGLIAHEMKFNIKKESEEELRFVKGLMNQTFNSFVVPMVSEASALATSILKAERVVFFMYNKDIDHLYSLSSSGP
jgi:hypothetical protein